MFRSTARLAWVAVACVTLVLAHEIVFLVAYGSTFGSVLAETGHDGRWTRAVVAVLAVGMVLMLAAGWRLRQLGALARSARATPSAESGPGGHLHPTALARHVLRAWLSLTASTSVLFVIQENAERVGLGQDAPGLSVLRSPEYPNGLLVIVAVAFVVALVAGLFCWRRDALAAQIATVRARWPRVEAAAKLRAPAIQLRPASILGRRQALRAPPASA